MCYYNSTIEHQVHIANQNSSKVHIMFALKAETYPLFQDHQVFAIQIVQVVIPMFV